MDSYFEGSFASRMNLTAEQLAEEKELRNEVISHIAPMCLNNIEIFDFFDNPFDAKTFRTIIDKYAAHTDCLESAMREYGIFISQMYSLAFLDTFVEIKDVAIGDPVNSITMNPESVRIYSPVDHTLLMEAKLND